jgi:hypothetical protein
VSIGNFVFLSKLRLVLVVANKVVFEVDVYEKQKDRIHQHSRDHDQGTVNTAFAVYALLHRSRLSILAP